MRNIASTPLRKKLSVVIVVMIVLIHVVVILVTAERFGRICADALVLMGSKRTDRHRLLLLRVANTEMARNRFVTVGHRELQAWEGALQIVDAGHLSLTQ